MNFVHVNSTDINSVAINSNNLVIKFNSGELYEYINAVIEFDNLINAPSKGKYFHQHIKNNYTCVRINNTK